MMRYFTIGFWFQEHYIAPGLVDHTKEMLVEGERRRNEAEKSFGPNLVCGRTGCRRIVVGHIVACSAIECGRVFSAACAGADLSTCPACKSNGPGMLSRNAALENIVKRFRM